MSKMARTKGLNFERQIAQALRVVYPSCRRHLENHEDDAAHGADLLFTGPYRVQCKRLRKYVSLSAIKEVKADELLGQVPVLVTQGDHERILVALPFEEFVRLIKHQRKGSY